MSTGIIVQYVGFQAKPLSREYTFHVRGPAEERDFTFNIANEAFTSHRARYQGCTGHLLREAASGTRGSLQQPRGNAICNYCRRIGVLSRGSLAEAFREILGT